MVGEDPALEIACHALQRMVNERAELEPALEKAQRLDRGIRHQRQVIARLRGKKAKRPDPASDRGRMLALLEKNPRGLSVESMSRSLEWDRHRKTTKNASHLVAMGWVERLRPGVYRAVGTE